MAIDQEIVEDDRVITSWIPPRKLMATGMLGDAITNDKLVGHSK